MAIAVDNVQTGFLATAGASLTVSLAVGSGNNRYLVAYFANGTGSSSHCTAVTYGGVSLTLVKTIGLGGGATIDVYEKVAPASGTANVVFTIGPSNIAGCGVAICFTGVDQTTPRGSFVTAGPTFGTAPSATVSSPPSDSLVLDCTGGTIASGNTHTLGADQTKQADFTNTATFTAYCSTQPGSAGGVMSWTLSQNKYWAMVAFAINAASGSAALLAGSIVPVFSLAGTLASPVALLVGSITPLFAITGALSGGAGAGQVPATPRFVAGTLPELIKQLNDYVERDSAGALFKGGIRFARRTGLPQGAPQTSGSPNLVLATVATVDTLYWWNGTAWVALGGGGGVGLTLSVFEQDMGSIAVYGGNFQITGLSGLTANKPVLVHQAPGPYTGKGTLQDEPELDMVFATGYVVNATTIQVYWMVAPHFGPIAGKVKFLYQVSA